MKNEEARFVLHAYRPGGADAGDTMFAAALAQVQQDPALAKWFTAQQSFDRTVATKLCSIMPPADLRASILTGAKVSHAEPTQSRSWWRASWSMAVAAGVAVMLSLGAAFWPKPVVADEITSFAISDMLNRRHEEPHGAEAAEFQTMLNKIDHDLRERMKVDFASLRDGGCHKLNFRGRELLEVCFNRDGKWFHCYVARAADFPSVAAKLTPQFTDRSAGSAVAWSDGKNIYVVASRAGREALQQLI